MILVAAPAPPSKPINNATRAPTMRAAKGKAKPAPPPPPAVRMPHSSVYRKGPKPWPPRQVVDLLLPLRGTRFMKAAVERLHESGCVTVAKSNVARMVARAVEGKELPAAWGMGGKQLLVTDEELVEVMKQYSLAKGETISEKQLEQDMTTLLTKKAKAAGKLFAGELVKAQSKWLKQTFQRLLTLKVGEGGAPLTTVRKVIYKPPGRKTAADSVRAPVCYSALLLNIRRIMMPPPSDLIHRRGRSLSSYAF